VASLCSSSLLPPRPTSGASVLYAAGNRIAIHNQTSGSHPIRGIETLWRQTLGDPEVCVAILDGPVALTHPCLRGALLQTLPSLVSEELGAGPASRHGTHVASVIFGQHHQSLRGVAPRCRGIIIPIFESADAHSFGPCSQLDLARAVTQAMEHGAH